jgi:ArsR family transcriptional regulator, arsenate/arsenite/antimonite-responsive transcriptional repressor
MSLSVDLLGDGARRRMLAVLAVEGEVCVCEFVSALDQLRPAVSRNFGLLRDGGWITSWRDGTRVHYRLARVPKWARTMLDGLVLGGVPPAAMRDARSRLTAFPGRPSRARRKVARVRFGRFAATGRTRAGRRVGIA